MKHNIIADENIHIGSAVYVYHDEYGNFKARAVIEKKDLSLSDIIRETSSLRAKRILRDGYEKILKKLFKD